MALRDVLTKAEGNDFRKRADEWKRDLLNLGMARGTADTFCDEANKLSALIKAHNERVAAACKWRQENGHCDYAKRGDLCPDCPQEWEIGND